MIARSSAFKGVPGAVNLAVAGVLLAAAFAPLLMDLPEMGAGRSWVRIRPPECFVRRETGKKCPGCGLTRSIVAVYHGKWELARHHHPLGPTLVGVLLGELLLQIVLLAIKVPGLIWADLCQLVAVALGLRFAL